MPKISELVKTDELGRVIGEVRVCLPHWNKNSYSIPLLRDKLGYWICLTHLGDNGWATDNQDIWQLWTPPQEKVEVTLADIGVSWEKRLRNYMRCLDDLWQQFERIVKEKK